MAKPTLESMLCNIKNPQRMKQLYKLVSSTNDKKSFLENDKRLIVFERNDHFLKHIAERLVHSFMPDYISNTFEAESYLPVENTELRGLTTVYKSIKENENNLSLIKTRTKSPDSYVEKSARKLGELEKKLSKENKLTDQELSVDDGYGIIFVLETEKDCYGFKEKLRNYGEHNDQKNFRLIFQEEENYYLGFKIDREGNIENLDNSKQYRAIHTKYLWENGDDILKGFIVETHIVSMEDYLQNNGKAEVVKNQNRVHKKYAEKKVNKPHTLKDHQVVIVDYESPNYSVVENFPFESKEVELKGLNTSDGQDIKYHILRPEIL